MVDFQFDVLLVNCTTLHSLTVSYITLYNSAHYILPLHYITKPASPVHSQWDTKLNFKICTYSTTMKNFIQRNNPKTARAQLVSWILFQKPQVLLFSPPAAAVKTVLDSWVASTAASLIISNSGAAANVSESAGSRRPHWTRHTTATGCGSFWPAHTSEGVQHQGGWCKSTEGPFPPSRNQCWHRFFVFFTAYMDTLTALIIINLIIQQTTQSRWIIKHRKVLTYNITKKTIILIPFLIICIFVA